MAKITLNTILSSFASTSLFNTNFSAIQTELNDKVLYRDNPAGEPNQMMNDLDMNSNDILNTATVNADIIVLGGTQITPSGVTTLPADQLTYDNTTSGLTATDVQAAIDEVDGNVDNLQEDSIQLCTATFSSNTYTVTPISSSFRTLASNLVIEFDLPTGSVTTAQAQINYNGTTDNVNWIDNTATVSDDLDFTYIKRIRCRFDGTDWRILSDVSGNNSNGYWYRGVDGSQITSSFKSASISAANSGAITVTFPKPFSNTDYCLNPFVQDLVGGGVWIPGRRVSPTTSSTDITFFDYESGARTGTLNVRVCATGRWY